MSVAKGALLSWARLQEEKPAPNFIYSGDLDFFHSAVDEAGAKQCSFRTNHLVLSCLRNSRLWEKVGEIPGWNGRVANCYAPSKCGLAWIEENKTNR